MPGTPPTSPRHGAPRYANADASDFAGQVNAITDRFDITAGRFESGLLASRPSTGAGIADRYYFATDDTSGGPSGTLYRDAGGGTPTWNRVHTANAEAAFSTWKDVFRVSAGLSPSGPAGTYMINNGTYLVGAANSGFTAFYLDPSDYAAGSRTTKYRIRWGCLVNAANTATTLTTGLSPITTFGGASGSQPTVASVAAQVSGSTAAFISPLANTTTVTLSTEFNAPAAAMYAFTVILSSGLAAGSSATIFAALQVRQV